MKLKKITMACFSIVLSVALIGCGSKTTNQDNTSQTNNSQTEQKSSEENLKYADVKLGETGKDLNTTIKFYNNRTDMASTDYAGKTWDEYVKDFNEMYPDIKVEIETDSAYADNSLIRLQGGDWGDIMFIPSVDKIDLSTYFLSYGDLDTMEQLIRYAVNMDYDNQVYGISCNGTAQGIVYNKAVFKAAGIEELPKTPEAFINALKAVKEKTDAIPLYTNYAAGWTMGAWDAYIGGTATGDSTYNNQILIHTPAPFTDPGDQTHAYNVYKILYDAVAEGLIEDDFSTTDWEGSKGMLNKGEIACMALGSWAFSQIQQAGDHPEDVGYMPFPITVNGKNYATSAGNYTYGINLKSSEDNQLAALIFVKWMTEKSGYALNEGGIPTDINNNELPDTYADFGDTELILDEPSVKGEEDFRNMLNADSELMLDAGGNKKVQSIVEHAANNDMDFDEIMSEWNAAWKKAMETNAIEQKY